MLRRIITLYPFPLRQALARPTFFPLSFFPLSLYGGSRQIPNPCPSARLSFPKTLNRSYSKLHPLQTCRIITVSTMGYGDVLPVNHEERMFAIFVSVFGAVTFSYCMANMTAMITQSTGADSKFDDLLLSITEYLEFRKIPSHIKLKVTFSTRFRSRLNPQLVTFSTFFRSRLGFQLVGFRAQGGVQGLWFRFSSAISACGV